MNQSKITLSHPVKSLSAVGIDVAQATVSVCLYYGNHSTDDIVLDNTKTDITFLAQVLAGFSGKTVMESTGRHHLLPALLLSQAGLDVRVINPLIVKKYTTASIRKVKSDKSDARILAEIALKEQRLPPSFKPDRISLKLKKKVSLLAMLDKKLQQFEASLREYRIAMENLGEELSETENSILNLIRELKAQKRHLEQELTQLAQTDNHQTELIRRYQTVPGVSAVMAALTAEYLSPELAQQAKQWIAFAGLDISVRQSGTWQGHGKLTKRGNPYLRKRLFCAAWGAVMHDARFRQYYDVLKEQGHAHVESLLIIARKILRILWKLSQSNAMYDPVKAGFPA